MRLSGGAADLARPGWSTTRGIAILDEGDHLDEYDPNGKPLDVNSDSPVDMVRHPPCDRQADKMDQLQRSWLSDPDKAAVDGRLKRMDGEAWASQAHKASRSELREMMSDMVEDVTDEFY